MTEGPRSRGRDDMRVAVFHNLPSGGAQRALHGVVSHLAKVGCTVDVFTPSTAEDRFLSLTGLARTVTVSRVRTTLGGLLRSTLRYLPPVGPLNVSLADLEASHRQLAATINRGDYDAVLVEQDRYTMSPFILKFLDTPHVYYCQHTHRLHERLVRTGTGQTPDGPKLRRLERLAFAYGAARLSAIDRQNAAAAGTILANSYFSRETILRAYGRSASVCYLGVDADVFRPRSEPRADYILSVGYIGPLKGYDFLVHALARIDERRRPKLLVVANAVDGGWQQHLVQLAADRRVTLEIRLQVSDEELVDLYNRATLFVYAPHLEPFGLAPLEAMACGTP